MAKPESFLVSCDIGSSKICVLIGEQNAHGALDVIGKGASPNRGTRKGNIINVDATIDCAIQRITKAIIGEMSNAPAIGIHRRNGASNGSVT